MNIVKPNRKEFTCTQTWKGSVNVVFPLLCPVKEADWIPGWEPNLVISSSGLMEKNCIFVELEGEEEAIWVVPTYEHNRYLDMYRILPGVSISQFSILLKEKGELTEANITYGHTSLGEQGDKVVDEFTEESFNAFMGHFETAINHYLLTGKMIEE